ncbi:DUF2520 domain-containing protein [uncultured Bacteroides sp.]|jgi:predicted short-subunit dehydrogenase-like oxidoreductase (DUF2520 family)|uniref:Rossmann-like and DUF2520 domain-containing protein n=1 Tax=uncultured Bacteroides sp. TaxID=162156 RepID=UPI00280B8337|nr:DUF2520 domain-containing protein [uncultured Bacteroides sp.]
MKRSFFSDMDIKNIVLIGAGNVATHFGVALEKAGYTVKQVYSRTEVSAVRLADRLACPYTVSLADVFPDADVYIVSVKDSALDEVLPELVKRNRDALYVHTAGSVPMDVWKGLARRYGVLYPMQTFSRERAVDFSTVPFFVEADSADDLELLEQMGQRMGGKVYEATSEQRRYLHIAAVFACNFANHMYAIAGHLLEKNGIPFEVMLPLIDETARKAHVLPPVEGQTGPAQRYDRNVMDRHLAMLADEPQLAEIYRLLSRNIHEYAMNQKEGQV